MELSPQSPLANKFTAKCILHQSRYRSDILNEPCGNGPTKNSKKTYGNMLVNGGASGSNFISTAAYEFANVIISSEEDSLSETEIDAFETGMTKYNDTILKISLQEFVRRGLFCKNDEIELLMNKFRERYLSY